MEAYECVPCSSREDWLTRRREGIGASECAAVLGLSKYESPYSLWARRTGRAPERESTPAMLAGLEWEPYVRDKFKRLAAVRLGVPQVGTYYRDHDLRRSRERPYVMATLDGWCVIDGVPAVLEIKTADPRTDFDDRWGGANPPAAVTCQVLHQLYVCGWQRAYVAAQIGLSEFRIFTVERNERFISMMLRRLDEFWHCLQADEAPLVDGTEATREALNQLDSDPDLTIYLEEEASAVAHDLEVAKARLEDAAADVNLFSSQLKRMIGAAERAVLPDGAEYTFKTQTRAAHQAKESTYRVLRRVKAKVSETEEVQS